MLIETNIFKSLKKAYKSVLPQKDFLNVTVMLSAGVDSVALAHFAVKNKHILTRLFNTKDININFYHFNHKLRLQNETMEQKAKELASSLNTEIVIRTSNSDCSTEQKAREERFKYFKTYEGLILTAHHINDCIESYLMNAFRGHENRQPIPFVTQMNNAYIVHPILFTEKNALKVYTDHYNLNHFIIEDETNTVIKGSRRNLIRNKILPILTDENISLQSIVKRKMLTKLTTIF